MRIESPCTENLDGMARTRDGSFCAKCEKNVVDLRRVPKKRALAVISELRETGDGQVCVRVRATREGVPVFPNDPSRFARFALPMALAGSLAACAPTPGSAAQVTTPVVIVAEGRTNGNGTPDTQPVTVTITPVTSTTTPVVDTNDVVYPPDTVEMAGGLAFSP